MNDNYFMSDEFDEYAPRATREALKHAAALSLPKTYRGNAPVSFRVKIDPPSTQHNAGTPL